MLFSIGGSSLVSPFHSFIRSLSQALRGLCFLAAFAASKPRSDPSLYTIASFAAFE
jgi:hypothetical protein